MRILVVGSHPFFWTNLRVANPEDRDLCLDARRLKFVSPLDLAGMAALAHGAARQGRAVSLIMPEKPSVASYVQRMDLLRNLQGVAEVEGDIPPEDRADRSDVLLELTQIAKVEEVEPLAASIVPLVRKHASPLTKALFMGLGEFLDNACSHASSPVGVFAAAQAYTGETSGRRGLEFAVVDGGIGILDHLRHNPRYARFRQCATAIEYALKPGVSGTPDRRGYGFSDVLVEVRQVGLGRLVVRSGDGIGRVTVHHARERTKVAQGRIPVQGTWVWLRVRIP